MKIDENSTAVVLALAAYYSAARTIVRDYGRDASIQAAALLLASAAEGMRGLNPTADGSTATAQKILDLVLQPEESA